MLELRRMLAVTAAAAASVAVVSAAALACSFEGPGEFELDVNEQQLDVTAPGAPTRFRASVREGEGEERVGCGQYASNSCADIGTLDIAFERPADDRTASDDLGFIIEIEGDTPRGMLAQLPVGDAVMLRYNTFTFAWTDPDPGRDDGYDFAVRISAVDRGGNVSEPSEWARVRSEGDSGCAIVHPRGLGGGLIAVVVALTWGAMRRRLRRERRA